MEEKIVNFADSNVKSVTYNEVTKDMTVVFGGGSKWKYRNVESEVLDTVLPMTGALSILESVRHQHIVGVRIR